MEARRILTQYRQELDAVANKLLEVETLSREEFEAIFPPPVPQNIQHPHTRSSQQLTRSSIDKKWQK